MAFRLSQRALLVPVLFLFFASGLAALLYQTIWQRMLGFFSGVDVYSVTITVAAFMAGLGCGSLAGGYLADHLSAKHRLLAFGLAEGIITLFALGSKTLYYDLLYVRWSVLADSPVLLPVILFVSLLIPTFCMGLTLPILTKAFTARIETASAVVGFLYGANTLGAAVGALLTPWFLLRHFSFVEVLRLGASLNALCAIGALLIWWRAQPDGAVTPARTIPENASSAETHHFPAHVWMLIYALSGFIALSLEIVWFRFLGVLQKSTSFTFPTLLAVYLGGLAFGVIAGVPLVKRIRRPTIVFLGLQSGVTLYAGSALVLFFQQVSHGSSWQPLWKYLGSYEYVVGSELLRAISTWFSGAPVGMELAQNARFILLIYFLVPTLLIAPSTFMMGMSFPVLQKLVQNNSELLGRRVGWLQTMNIAGSMLGALLVGWCFLGWFGSAGTLKLLVLVGGLLLCLLAWHLSSKGWARFVGILAAVGVVGSLAAAMPGSNKFWAKLHGTTPDGIIAREGASGLAVLKGSPVGFDQDVVWVFSNGLGQSWLPYGSVHTLIGLLAVALHPRPEDVAVIGLGSGDTVYALGGSPSTRSVTCLEIVQPTRETLKEVAPRISYPALDALLADSRIHWIFTDGRAYILRSGKQFDVIEADALYPNSAYSGNLYSCEYFRTLKAHLKSGGLAITWTPTERVLASFLEVFPYAIVIDGIAIGSNQPIEVDNATILQRFADPFTIKYYQRIGTDLRPLVANLLAGKFIRQEPGSPRSARLDLNSDLYPRDEYMVPLESKSLPKEE